MKSRKQFGLAFIAVASRPVRSKGQHTGDLPSVYVNGDGSFEVTYTLDKVNREELTGKAVIMHAGADNFGNVPVGAEPDKYTANSQAATDLTNATGNVGARVACGVIG